MATLITETNSGGSRRRCDARCYLGTGTRCSCICGGRNHGRGIATALEETRRLFAPPTGANAPPPTAPEHPQLTLWTREETTP
jgi:hypothetical protein